MLDAERFGHAKAADHCAACRFFASDDSQCRRHAPVWHAFAGDVSERTGSRMVEEVSGWPFVDPTDWCGEFEQRLCGVAGCVLPDGHADRWHRLIDGKLILEMEGVDG